MAYSAFGVKVKLLQLKNIEALESSINAFIEELAKNNYYIIDVRYDIDKDEFSTNCNAMILYSMH